MLKVLQSPGKYVQGPDALAKIADYIAPLGKKAFVIADEFVFGLVKEIVEKSCQTQNIPYSEAIFQGECSAKEIDRLSDAFKQSGADIVVGIGGGKTLDAAKAVAHYGHAPIIIAPTIASTDAPTSALSVIYTDNGEFESYLLYPKNPDVVLMDTRIIANAPVRLFVAGMGDALATYFEARSCSEAQKTTMAGGLTSLAAMSLATLCYETLLEEGFKAKLAVENKVSTKAVENIVEANTLLSGLGFESAGLAAAHAIHNGLTVIEACHDRYHGEKVAFGTLVQLVLENSPMEEIEEVLDFCTQVGLPVTLAELGLTTDAPNYHELLHAAAELSCAKGETIYNMPFEVKVEDVYAALLTADRLGRAWRNEDI
ncbi:glycerol dehydrogenase [Wohlfahrtiimonas chitiniclastica]|uniref:glycerol dehydrogenase n=1 Tax=Wohlfahrtiimonas chitiniclastica TaxID=400946 RepID=UPI00037DFEFE|nr:glycerol dehydrogenase [Wohlfahrtiimonas chitiniclastica]